MGQHLYLEQVPSYIFGTVLKHGSGLPLLSNELTPQELSLVSMNFFIIPQI